MIKHLIAEDANIWMDLVHNLIGLVFSHRLIFIQLVYIHLSSRIIINSLSESIFWFLLIINLKLYFIKFSQCYVSVLKLMVVYLLHYALVTLIQSQVHLYIFRYHF